jgi:hypothetical protein
MKFLCGRLYRFAFSERSQAFFLAVILAAPNTATVSGPFVLELLPHPDLYWPYPSFAVQRLPRWRGLPRVTPRRNRMRHGGSKKRIGTADADARPNPSAKSTVNNRRTATVTSDHVYKRGDQVAAGRQHQDFVKFEAQDETYSPHGYLVQVPDTRYFCATGTATEM